MATEVHGRRRVFRWVRRIVLGLVGFVVLAVGAALGILHTDWGRDVVRAQVEAQLQNTFVGGATIGKIEGSPFGELVIRDLVINGPDRQPAISVKQVAVEIALSPLLSKQASITRIDAQDVDVLLKRDPDGTLQISRLTKPGPSSGWSVDLPDLRLRRAHIMFDTGTAPLNFDAIDLRAALHMPYGKPLDANVIVSGQWRERAAPFAVEAVVRNELEQLRVPYVNARIAGASVAAVGVRMSKQPLPAMPYMPAPPPVPMQLTGTIIVSAPKAAVAQLAPGVELPEDIAAAIQVRPVAAPWHELVVTGNVGGEPLSLIAHGDLEGKRARGVVATGDVDATKLSRGAVQGHGAVFAIFDAAAPVGDALPVVNAMVHAWGEVAGIPNTSVVAAVATDAQRMSSVVGVGGKGGLQASVFAEVSKLGKALKLDRGMLVARTTDPRAASGGLAPVRGAIDARLQASGQLSPNPSLAVAGKVGGKRLRVADVSVSSFQLAIDARQLPSRPLGRMQLVAHGVQRQDIYLRKLELNAANREDGKIAVSLRTTPKQSPWLAELDALVTPGETIYVDIARHHVRAGNRQDWAGRGGRVTIGPQQIEVRDLTTASKEGKLAVAGTFQRAGRRAGDITGRAVVTQLSLDQIDPNFAGKLDATVAVTRTRGKFAGTAELAVAGVTLAPNLLIFETTAKLRAAPGVVEVDLDATSTGLGTVRLDLDVAAPQDLTNVVAWKKLTRQAVRTGRLQLEQIDVARIATLTNQVGEYRGTIDGDIKLASDGTGGSVRLRGLKVPQLRGGTGVNAELTVTEPQPDVLQPTLTASVDGVGKVDAQATIEVPDRLFDPAAWRTLGRRALRTASVRAENIAFDPGVLDRFGVISNLRGNATLVAEVGEGVSSAKVDLLVRQLRGDPIALPVDIRVVGQIDGAATLATVTVASAPRAATATQKAAPAVALLDAKARIPLTLAQVQANPRAAMTVPITGTATLPNVPAKELLAIFGRSQLTGGTLSGTVELTGTLTAPSVRAKLAGTGISVPPGAGNRPVKKIDRITVDGTWDGTTAKVTVDGTQQASVLRLVAAVNPKVLAEGTVRLEARQFDLAPMLAFLPGPAGGAGGTLDAKLDVKGFDPQTAQIAGTLHIARGRVPIAPQVGTLRRAEVNLVVGNGKAKVDVDGRLGGGTVKLTGTFGMSGATPTGGEAKLELRKVAPIGSIEPQINADVTTKLTRRPDAWVADIAIRNATVKVPDDRGEKLKPIGAPPDMVFLAGGARLAKPGDTQTGPKSPTEPGEKPARPAFIANVTLYSTYVESTELRGLLKGKLQMTADAETIALVGSIDADRGDLDLFGRRYQVERASVRFDGSTDPLLDIRISFDFPEVTTVTEIHGRASAPEIVLSSNPGIYSQGQLLGFLLGGEPNGEPASGNARDAAASAGTSFVANKLGGYVKDALPIDIDVLKYESATASSSAAITIGTWITRSLFVAYRRRLEARPDENAGEGELQYWLSRRVMLEGVLGDRGYNGVDMLWRKRY